MNLHHIKQKWEGQDVEYDYGILTTCSAKADMGAALTTKILTKGNPFLCHLYDNTMKRSQVLHKKYDDICTSMENVESSTFHSIDTFV